LQYAQQADGQRELRGQRDEQRTPRVAGALQAAREADGPLA
jgi:hypothetical protein